MNELVVNVGDCDISPMWTHDDATAYESACECITDLVAIVMATVYEEEAKPTPDHEWLRELRLSVSKLWKQRNELHVHSHVKIEHIRNEYGAKIRDWREAMKAGDVVDIEMKALLISL